MPLLYKNVRPQGLARRVPSELALEVHRFNPSLTPCVWSSCLSSAQACDEGKIDSFESHLKVVQAAADT